MIVLSAFNKLSTSFGLPFGIFLTRVRPMISKSGCTAVMAMGGDCGNVTKYICSGSGEPLPLMLLPTLTELCVPNILPCFPAEDGQGQVYMRDKDAEFKLLNVAAGYLNKLEEASRRGVWVSLFIEQKPCESCATAIRKFRELYPAVVLEIQVGGKDTRSSLKLIRDFYKIDKKMDYMDVVFYAARNSQKYL